MIGWQSSDLLCVRGEERQAKKGQCGGLGDAYSKAENTFKEKTWAKVNGRRRVSNHRISYQGFSNI